MRTFKDNAGRTWSIQVNVDALKRVRSLLAVDLLEVLEGKLIDRLSGDPVFLCDVLYAVVKPEADAQKVSDEDFGRAMGGDALDGAIAALSGELVDFFPQGRRKVLRKLMDKFDTFQAMILTRAEQRLISPELDAQFEAALAERGSSSGGSPASSE
ncbi:MAG TPA: hypothetical protein PK280_18475 [Planctomycetota bacterium]|nr:hypothetical protein [Planctomycetota bacterium]